jgi:hypothetical protein
MQLPKFIPDKNLKALDSYKYNGGEYTTLDNICNIFWNWAIRLMPPTLHPNMITLLGSSMLVFTISMFFTTGVNPLVESVPSVFFYLQ